VAVVAGTGGEPLVLSPGLPHRRCADLHTQRARECLPRAARLHRGAARDLRYRCPAARTPARGERSAVVGFAGRLIPEKGADVFLRAASLVAGVVLGARFVVIGDGRLRGVLEALAGDLGLLEERVRFLGFRDDAADLIAGLDILAVPSRSEGTALVVGEAMAAGVPVVVSRVGGLPDQVTHRRTGLVVDPQDPEGLAAALVSLLLAPDEARQLGEAGRGYAARFPHAALVDRMEEVYSEARPGRKIRSGETRSAASEWGAAIMVTPAGGKESWTAAGLARTT
jgi:glycosyltransferase involved in cell wall biosynthesis